MDEHLEPILPPHIEETVRAVAMLHAEHERQTSPMERFAERVIAFVARPVFVRIVTLAVVSWIALNTLASKSHLPVLDPPPYAWMQGAISLAALYMTVLILGTQRRADRLAEHRAQLTLEIAIVGEQKSAKLIELLEELRRDHPEIADRHDSEASSMAISADPEAILDAIKDTRAEMTVDR